MNKIHITILVLAILFALARIFLGITEGPAETLLWFCVTLLFLFPIALALNNKLLLGSVVTSGFVINTALALDYIAFLFTQSLLIGIGSYITELSTFGLIITSYHILLAITPLYIVIKQKRLHTLSWAVSSIHFLALAILTRALPLGVDVNCTIAQCALGPLTFIYALKPAFLPFFIFHWILVTLVLFIPTQLVISYFLKRFYKQAT